MKLFSLFKKLSLLALSGVVLNGCTQGETLVEELASGSLSLINFNGKSDFTTTVYASDPTFLQTASCDSRVSKIEISINGGAYKAVSQFAELNGSSEDSCSDGSITLEHNSDLTVAGPAGVLYFDGTEGQTHTIKVRGLVESVGVEDFATLTLVYSSATAADNPTIITAPGNLNIIEDVAYSENVTLSDIDAPVDSVTVTLVSGDPDCDVLIANSFDAGNQWVTFSSSFDNSSSNFFVHPENCQYQIDADQGGNITTANVTFVLQNAQPSITVTQSSFTLIESAGTTNILSGANVDSNDEGVGPTTYAIVDDAVGSPMCDGSNASVTINSTTGATSVNPVVQGTCDFLLEVNDGSGAANARNWSLITINVNGPPILSGAGSTLSINEGEAASTVFEVISATDPDGGDIPILGISDTCSNFDFALDGANNLYNLNSPPESDVGADVCQVIITADDGHPHPYTEGVNQHTIDVSIINVLPAPDLSGLTLLINENGGDQALGDMQEPLHEPMYSYNVVGITNIYPSCTTMGSFSWDGPGNLSFFPNSDASGRCEFQVSMTDAYGTGSSAFQVLSIRPEAPVISVDTVLTGHIDNDTNPSFFTDRTTSSENVTLHNDSSCVSAPYNSTNTQAGANRQDITLIDTISTESLYSFYAKSTSWGVESNCSPVPAYYQYDNSAPSVVSIEFNGGDTAREFFQEERLRLKITFDEPVKVVDFNNRPYIPLTATSGTYHLEYKSGSGSDVLIFEYGLFDGTESDSTGPGASFGNFLINANSIHNRAGIELAASSYNVGTFMSSINGANTINLNPNPYCSGGPFSGYMDAGGDGSAANPYRICDAAQLESIADACGVSTNTVCNSHFRLMDYIDMTSISGTFQGIGNSVGSRYFRGVFDGNHFGLSNWTHSSGASGQGLFRWVQGDADGAAIKNLFIDSFSLSVGDMASFLVGQSSTNTGSNFVIENVFAGESSTINGSGYIGGLMGTGLDMDIIGSGALGDIDCNTGAACGGIIGSGTSVNITRSFNKVNITGTGDDYGGVVGLGNNVTLNQVVAGGDITGNSNIGGIVGRFAGTGAIVDCAYKGDINANSSAGGIIGTKNTTTVGLNRCINAADFQSGSGLGGIIGTNVGTGVTGIGNFWDQSVSGILVAAGGGPGIFDQNIARSLDPSDPFYGPYKRYPYISGNFDFNSIWDISDGNDYPYITTVPFPEDDSELVIFLSSATSVGNPSGGIDDLDQLCRNDASTQVWDNSNDFKAILSTGTKDAKDRLTLGPNNKIYDPNDNLVADGSHNFWGAALLGQFYLADGSSFGGTSVWTGSDINGVYSGNSCGEWDTNSMGGVGNNVYWNQNTTQNWLDNNGATNTCSTPRRVYCIGPRHNSSGGGPIASFDTGYSNPTWISYSNSDTTVSKSSVNTSVTNFRTISAQSSGQYYFEVVIVDLAGNSNGGIYLGFATPGLGSSTTIGTSAVSWGCEADDTNGCAHNGSSPNSIGTFGDGDRIGIAVNLNTGEAWYRVNGTWTLGGTTTTLGSPAFGPGTSNSIVGPVHIAGSIRFTNLGGPVVLDFIFDSGSWAASPPIGFDNEWPP